MTEFEAGFTKGTGSELLELAEWLAQTCGDADDSGPGLTSGAAPTASDFLLALVSFQNDLADRARIRK